MPQEQTDIVKLIQQAFYTALAIFGILILIPPAIFLLFSWQTTNALSWIVENSLFLFTPPLTYFYTAVLLLLTTFSIYKRITKYTRHLNFQLKKGAIVLNVVIGYILLISVSIVFLFTNYLFTLMIIFETTGWKMSVKNFARLYLIIRLEKSWTIPKIKTPATVSLPGFDISAKVRFLLSLTSHTMCSRVNPESDPDHEWNRVQKSSRDFQGTRTRAS